MDRVCRRRVAQSLASDTLYEYDAFGRLSTLRVLTVAGEPLSGTEIQMTREVTKGTGPFVCPWVGLEATLRQTV